MPSARATRASHGAASRLHHSAGIAIARRCAMTYLDMAFFWGTGFFCGALWLETRRMRKLTRQLKGRPFDAP